MELRVRGFSYLGIVNLRSRKMCRTISRFIITILAIVILPSNALGWSSKTHIFIAQESGIKNPEAANFPDLSKKDNNALLGPFHWHDAAPTSIVTPDYID